MVKKGKNKCSFFTIVLKKQKKKKIITIIVKLKGNKFIKIREH